MSTEPNESGLIRPANEQLPAFMQGEDTFGDELMGKYIRPPRVKIIQPQAREPYDSFEPGEVIIVPQLLKIAGYDKATKKGTIWQFVPIFFYPEWCTWNELGSELPMIAERTFDPTHEIAVKAQSPETWEEELPDGAKVRHTEHLNFIIAPLFEEMLGMQFAISFLRAEMKQGTTLCSLIRMRNAPMCGQIFDAQVGHRKNAKGQWYGIDCRIPQNGSLFVEDENLYNLFKEQHEKYKQAHEEQGIAVDFEDEKSESVVDETEF